ncbi:putative DNA-binding domain-containing protein [Pseudoalteromonas shioyasakiensis]|uniref:HvfC family RiPP maturation protein n=1 Tax=Pseudoalteromonas shioyasakiensis TaxID=1190813 RepID=UPI002117CC44|nr:putative DNA-binding domain-containing protein [Pseudoalteromonas shioyasakiensis]MCQ8877606.1 putative DNA-binding domain-containing protein [Pseudoalteromonas shioyasakiensis]
MSFQAIQHDFMAHIRDPDSQSAPQGIEDRRMAIYRDLFFNNIAGFISSGFPVLKTFYSQHDWHALIRRFFIEHDCQSPYFLDIAGEFIHYLATTYTKTPADPIFIIELAHYEWVELDVSVCHHNEDEIIINPTDELASTALYFSDTARNLSYQFAVQQISVDHQPTEPSVQPHYYVVYRDSSDEVQFMLTNPMTALLLSLIEASPGLFFAQLCEQVTQRAPQFSAEQIRQGAYQTLVAMADKAVIVTKNQG